MANYNNFSPFYDLFTGDVDYTARAKYLLKIFERLDKKPSLLLDFACGTGNFSFQFAKMGIDVIGVDKSEGMLCEAQYKNAKLKKNKILFLCQSGEELDLFGTVDGAVCCLDSINHITDVSILEKTIQKISLFLEPQRLFVFDVNTIYKHKQVLGNKEFFLRKKGVECFWKNSLQEDNAIVNIDLEFTYKTGLFKKEIVTESFCERAYTEEEIYNILDNSGFKIEAIYGENTFSPPQENSQRNIYVARKAK